MQVAFIVLNNTDRLDELLKEFVNIGIKGATILDSMGMGGFLVSSENTGVPFFSTLRMLLNEGKPLNKTIFTVIEDEQVSPLTKVFESVVGALNKPNTGIIFTMPINYVKGGELS
jgi:nitrogen regulatory protein PII